MNLVHHLNAQQLGIFSSLIVLQIFEGINHHQGKHHILSLAQYVIS